MEQTPTSRDGGQRPPTDYQNGRQRRQPPRRNDVIRCENCGEDYSVTYKRCPFCDERPSRGGISGKRVANTRGGGYGRPASALQTAGWIASFLVVIAAMFIIYRFMGAPIFGGGKKPNDSSVSSSQGGASQDGSQSGGNTGTPAGPDASGAAQNPSTTAPPEDPAPGSTQGTIVNVSKGLNVRSGPGRDNGVIDSVSNGSQVTILSEENGWYQITYNGNRIGYVSKDYVSVSDAPQTTTPEPPVTPEPPSTPEPEPEPPAATEPEPEPQPSGGTVASGTQGTIVNAEKGVNIRSGPGTDNSVVASASNGAAVTILGEENGWYQIRYSGNQTGYVRKDFISVK